MVMIHKILHTVIGLAQPIDQRRLRRQSAPQNRVCGERRHRISAGAQGVRSSRVHRLVLVDVVNLPSMPALQLGQKQGWQHGHAGNGLSARQALADGGRDETRNLGIAVHGDALVGIANGRIAKTV